MKFTLRNLGRLAEASIDLDKDLILLTGPNNTSKTYVAHAIYGFCRHYARTFWLPFQQAFDGFIAGKSDGNRLSVDLLEFTGTHLQRLLSALAANYRQDLASVFATTQDFVAQTEIVLALDQQRMEDGKRRLRDLSLGPALVGRRTDAVLIHKKAGESVWVFERTANLSEASSERPEEPGSTGKASAVLHSTCRVRALVDIRDAFFNHLSAPFILTAERSAIQLFSRELSSHRTELVDDLLGMRNIGGSRRDAGEEILDALEQRARRYPLAIRDSVLTANNAGAWREETSLFAPLADRLDRDLLGGAIRVDEAGDIAFQPEPAGPSLTLHLASSSVKSLAGLSLFLRHIAETNQFLLIDEPELNLHPDNQRRVARVLARLARAGVKVLISTHSDYVIRELNNLVMLSADQDGTVRRRHGYEEEETLSPAQVGAYLFDTSRARPIEVAPTGIEVETIDREINALNAVSQDIYFSLFGKAGA